MNQKNFEELSKIAGVFHVLRNVGAVSPTSAEVQVMARVYKEEYKQTLNAFCNACVIEMIRVLGNQYDAHQSTIK